MIAFSVIVLAYNHAPYLEERITSILAQTYPHFEVILFDDGSSDNSRKIMEQYRNHPKISRLILNQTNTGFQSLNWQQAMKKAAHNWIWIAEGDDVADPHFLEEAASKLVENQPALYYTDAYRLEAGKSKMESVLFSEIKDSFFNVKHWCSDYYKNGKKDLDDFHKYVCIINNVSAAIIHRQTALEVLEQFSHKRFYSDWLFFAQNMEKVPVIYCSKTLTGYRSYSQSFFGKPGNELKKRIECFEILNYFQDQSYISGKKSLAKFFTEQYLGFGLWKQRDLFFPLWQAFFDRNTGLAITVFLHLLVIKITRKKIRYIF